MSTNPGEKSRRLEIVRQYLLDVDANPSTLLDAGDALNYLRWNFQKAVSAALSEADAARGVVRSQRSILDVPEESLRYLESPPAELRVGAMGRALESPERFAEWFHRKLVSPLLAEEDRVLSFSSTRRVDSVGVPRGHCDRGGRSFTFKVWETASFPDARNVPPRLEPSPDEVAPPAQRLE